MADGNGLPTGAASGVMEVGPSVNGAGTASPTPTSSSGAGAGASGSANQGYHQLSVTSEQTKKTAGKRNNQ